MKKQNLLDKDILRLGDKALKGVRLSDEDIERIVGVRELYDPIKAVISAGPPRKLEKSWPVLHDLGWQVGLATLGVFVVCIAALRLADFPHPEGSLQGNSTDIPSGVAPVDLAESPAVAIESSSGLHATPVYVSATQRTKKRVRSRATKRTPAKDEEYSEFYAITYAGDLEESRENGQLIRVELPRESLLALGIKIPPENGDEKIKTDLLIGEDGIMKAIRLVNGTVFMTEKK